MDRTQFNSQVCQICLGNGTEFTSNVVRHFFFENDIIQQTSCVGTAQQNGRVERKHCHLLNVAHTLCSLSN